MKQSLGKFRSQDALKNNGDLKSEQIRRDWDSFLIKSKKLNHWPASLEKRIGKELRTTFLRSEQTSKTVKTKTKTITAQI